MNIRQSFWRLASLGICAIAVGAMQSGCNDGDSDETQDHSTDTNDTDNSDSDDDDDDVDSDDDDTDTGTDSDSDNDTDVDTDTGPDFGPECPDTDIDWYVDAGPDYPYDGGYPDPPYGFNDSIDGDSACDLIDPAALPTEPVVWNGQGDIIPQHLPSQRQWRGGLPGEFLWEPRIRSASRRYNHDDVSTVYCSCSV
jgi:hypothetical protein